MKFTFFSLLCAALAMIFAMKTEQKSPNSTDAVASVEFPLLEHKSFVAVLYSYNQADWCERALRSVLSQDYDHFRVVFVDDVSSDESVSRVESFIRENNQQHRVSILRNEAHWGEAVSLYRAVDSFLDKEIVIPLQAKDWLMDTKVFERLNRAYQNPDLWLTFSPSILYPTYERKNSNDQGEWVSFYSALFKQIHLPDLIWAADLKNATSFLKGLSKNHGIQLHDPLVFENKASPICETYKVLPVVACEPLLEFPKPQRSKEKADLLIFSCDRPLQLYACLESIHCYMSGFETLSVLYRASSESFKMGYEKVKKDFPKVHFLVQSSQYKKDFKPLVLKAVFDSPSKYILFGVDDIIVKDGTDLRTCIEMMEKTGAYGFYLRFGKHISTCYQLGLPQPLPQSLPLDSQIYAWSLDEGIHDWGFANTLDMTLYRKSDLKTSFEKLKFKNPNSLEFSWAKEYRPKGAIGLYFDHSKIVNIPLNVVSQTGNPHMSYGSLEEMFAKFEEGFKIDIEPLYRIENPSPHFEYLPSFIAR